MQTQEQTVLLVSDDAAMCAAARKQLETNESSRRVAAVSTVDAARDILVHGSPTVILLEESAVGADPRDDGGECHVSGHRIEAIVSALAEYAPVVVIAPASHEHELSALVATGLADFVARSASCLSMAIDLIEDRLRQSAEEPATTSPLLLDGNNQEAFGETLRHELNNPLTGILGNAELLLAEVRRKNDGQLPNGGQQRLETIAALAVRLRETVRRLSQDWENRHRRVPQRTVQQRVAH
jgi:DNA-binding NarL/FixJ family response regulator